MVTSIIVGGDGFCGWPTALHLSNSGHEVVIVDNLSRRKIDIELGVNSLTPIAPIEKRLETWASLSNNKIDWFPINVASDYSALAELIKRYKPQNVIHFAEQRAAPYSMKNETTKRYTIDNNISATNNILVALSEFFSQNTPCSSWYDGVYGYSTAGLKIPEGYLDVEIKPMTAAVQSNLFYTRLTLAAFTI